MEKVVILNNIRSNENVGSIFRTADGAGVSKIILCGYTPAPLDRFGRENKGLVKASLGAEKSVVWEKFENLKEAIKNARSKNFVIVGVEQDKQAIDYRKIKQIATNNQHLALVFGNEVEGLSKTDLKLCDVVAELPMKGKKESLNVSVCAGIVLYSLITD
ncbi:MAG: RNA methyltransferase [Parcubacteria group bacterium]|jgi:tRNA G18 (ribose-2'-O)-methylase SpoU|nr:RNA methyltransferase [Parcubacteria group bacterium]